MANGNGKLRVRFGGEMKMEMRLIKSRCALENMPPKGLNDASQAKWRTRSAIKGFRCTAAAAPIRAPLRERERNVIKNLN